MAAALAACTHPRAASTPAEPPTVVVVSFDALGDRFLDRDTLPNFARMMREGVRAPFRPEFPSKTFPNHYSMATGLTPGQHGIVVNSFFDPALGKMFLRTSASQGEWFGGEPIWVTAGRAGIKTAAYFWIGSEAEIRGARPTYWYPFNATLPDSIKIVQIMRWLRMPAESRPRLIMLYSNVVDVPGHPYGPDSKQAFAGVRRADGILGVLRDSLSHLAPRPIDLIVVSDHGLISVPREHDIDMDSLLPKRGVIVDDEHATFSIWQDPAGPQVNLDSLAARYRRLVPHMRLFRPGEFPAEWETEQNRRFGDLFMLADPGWEFVTTVPRSIYTLGEHGYAPDTPQMMGIFLAVGPSFRSGMRLAPRENRTLHELLIHLLALQNPIQAAMPDFGLR
ncbi:MAG: ectonucleotide pyrophosphatase/phosphodiesterase [Gemmatimonadaceae bacterium]